MGVGMATASARSLTTLLSQSNDKDHPSNNDGHTANAALLVVGGAQEAMNAYPGNYRLVLKERKGFVKIALRTGAPLVPVFCFGEIDLYDQVSSKPGSTVRKLQEGIKRLTGIAPVLIKGRGIFQYSFGVLPRRRPLTTVVGAPIVTEKVESPTVEDIDTLHAKFCTELVQLFETHKHKYLENAEKFEIIIE